MITETEIDRRVLQDTVVDHGLGAYESFLIGLEDKFDPALQAILQFRQNHGDPQKNHHDAAGAPLNRRGAFETPVVRALES